MRMRAVRRWTVIAALVSGGIGLGAASPVHAEEPAEHAAAAAGDHPGGAEAASETPEIHGGKLGLQVFNFSVLLLVLFLAGRGAIRKALLARHQQMKADLAAASAARAEAEARLAQQETRLAALEQEIEAIRQGVKAEAEAEKARLIAMAEERAKRIREETTFVLDQQIKEAEARLRREVAEAAVDLAEQLVRKSLGAADQQRMVDAFVTDVASAPAAAPRGQA